MKHKLKILTIVANIGKSSHHVTCKDECTIYIRTKGNYSVEPK